MDELSREGVLRAAKPTTVDPSTSAATSHEEEDTDVSPVCGKTPIVIGHRGASGHKPEHTIESYRLAIEQGADYIEPDVVTTKDHVLIVRHENELSDTTDVAVKFPNKKTKKTIDGEVVEGWFSEDLTLSEIKKLRAKERLPFRSQKENGLYEVPTLEEVFTFIKLEEKKRGRRIGLLPELKYSTYFRSIGKPLEPKLIQLLKTYDLTRVEDPIMIQSFEITNLKELRKSLKVKLVQLISEPDESPADQVVMKGRENAITYEEMLSEKGLKDIAQYANFISPHKSLLIQVTNNRLVKNIGALVLDRADKAGLKVIVYTFRSDGDDLDPIYGGDSLSEYKEFYELGVYAVFTDFPDQAVKARKLYEEDCKN